MNNPIHQMIIDGKTLQSLSNEELIELFKSTTLTNSVFFSVELEVIRRLNK